MIKGIVERLFYLIKGNVWNDLPGGSCRLQSTIKVKYNLTDHVEKVLKIRYNSSYKPVNVFSSHS